MTKIETAKSLATASTDARVREIQRIADQTLEKTREMEATPEQIALKLMPLVESLTKVSEEAKSTLNEVQSTAVNLPKAYTAKIKTASNAAELAITQLTQLVLEVHEKTLQISSYATQMNAHLRRSLWRVAVSSGFLATVVPSILALGIARANGISPLRLIEVAVGLL